MTYHIYFVARTPPEAKQKVTLALSVRTLLYSHGHPHLLTAQPEAKSHHWLLFWAEGDTSITRSNFTVQSWSPASLDSTARSQMPSLVFILGLISSLAHYFILPSHFLDGLPSVIFITNIALPSSFSSLSCCMCDPLCFHHTIFPLPYCMFNQSYSHRIHYL